MNRTFLLFLIVAVCQLLVPAWMIADREITLHEGRSFRFRTAPVDPYDPFRGRYVSLRLETATAPVTPGENWSRGQKVYALIAKDGDGFARISGLTRNRPETGDYLQAPVGYHSGDTVHLRLPFDRYYADEHLAPEIERAYLRNSRREKRDAFITVRVRQGKGVLEELYVEGLPVRQYLAKKATENENPSEADLLEREPSRIK